MVSGRNSIKSYLLTNPTSSELLETTYSMYQQLQALHKKGYYAEKIDFDTLTFSQSEGTYKIFDFGFLNTSSDDGIFSSCCIGNIIEMTYTSLGIFAYNYSSDLQPSNPAYFDYSKISKQDPNFVINNYNAIRDSIPYGNEYFDNIMSGNYEYFNIFVDNQRKNSQSNKNGIGSYVKTTPFGKGYGEDDNNFAYIKVWIYPIIILCVALIVFVTYILYTHL